MWSSRKHLDTIGLFQGTPRFHKKVGIRVVVNFLIGTRTDFNKSENMIRKTPPRKTTLSGTDLIYLQKCKDNRRVPYDIMKKERLSTIS